MKNTKSMTVRESKIFPASKDKVFEILKNFDILKQITYPYISFEPINNSEDLEWKVGETFVFKARLLTFIPFGTHTINVLEFDKDKRIYTNEVNTYVSVWNHEVRLEALADGMTKYSDIVEIYAGWKTVFVYAWATLFYRHRQRQWVKILKQGRVDDEQKNERLFER